VRGRAKHSHSLFILFFSLGDMSYPPAPPGARALQACVGVRVRACVRACVCLQRALLARTQAGEGGRKNNRHAQTFWRGGPTSHGHGHSHGHGPARPTPAAPLLPTTLARHSSHPSSLPGYPGGGGPAAYYDPAKGPPGQPQYSFGGAPPPGAYVPPAGYGAAPGGFYPQQQQQQQAAGPPYAGPYYPPQPPPAPLYQQAPAPAARGGGCLQACLACTCLCVLCEMCSGDGFF